MAVSFSIFAAHHLVTPWQLAWHADFYGSASAAWVLLADAASATALFYAAYALLTASERRLRWALAGSYVAGLLWAYPLLVLQRNRAVTAATTGGRPEPIATLLWLPLAAPLFATAAAHVHAGVVGVIDEVEALRKTKYAFKTI